MNIEPERIRDKIGLLDPYLRDRLLAFWLDNAPDREFGGYLTYFDRNGEPMGKTRKTLIMQMRMIYTLASAHRRGYGQDRCAEEAARGLDFVLDHFWDRESGGWYWISDRRGRILDDSKIMYGQGFGVYALAEYSLAFSDRRALQYAERTFGLIRSRARDAGAGGYWEMFERDWSPRPGGAHGGDRKTFDVHMHLMEAFTTLFEATGKAVHREGLEEVVGVVVERMLHPGSGTGVAQFDGNFRPLPAVIFEKVWGSDRPPDKAVRPLDNTSYGHNLEMAWLLNHAVNVLGADPAPFRPVIRRLVDHALRWGLDREYGGLYVEGPHAGPASRLEKEFWQQAEALIGFLDAALLFEDRRYWDAFENVFDFIWNKAINFDVGEWWALLERDGTVRWDYLGHEWKICYHTVRAVILTLQGLARLQGESGH